MSNDLIRQPALGLSLADFITSGSTLSRKNELSRIRQFEQWLDSTGQNLLQVDLRDYRDFLLGDMRDLKASSANAHLNSIRGRYRRMMKSDAYRNLLGRVAAALAQQQGIGLHSIADQLALVNELERRIENRIFADDVLARTIHIQDEADEDKGLRLTEAQAIQLIRSPDVRTLTGLRDASLIAVMVCTGVREHEVTALEVDDLRCHYEGVLALRVKEGKGAKQRLIPYGSLIWCLNYVDAWLEHAGIEQDAIFRGFWGDSDSVRPHALSVRQVNRILERYPLHINGQLVTAKPHDLRRTYAKIQFNSGMEAEALQQNMGHASYDTTLRYIGDVDADKRMSQSTMPMPHALSELSG